MSRLCLSIVASAVAVLALPIPAHAQLVVLESGFAVTPLTPGPGAMQVECSPGGVWGDYVYVANTQGGTIERIDFSDAITPFAGPFAAPVGLAFGPGPGANFGTLLYVSDRGANATRKVTPAGVISSHASIATPGGLAFDPTSFYGNALFVPTAPGGTIYRVNPAGAPTVTFAVTAGYLKFAPGGAWGTGMYASSGTSLIQISNGGVVTPLAIGFGDVAGFAWASGGAFGGDLFAADHQSGEIWRVKPDGTRALWATLPGAGDVAYCNGALYVVSSNGGRFRVEDAPVPARAATIGELKARYR
jgi:hypothetical protein